MTVTQAGDTAAPGADTVSIGTVSTEAVSNETVSVGDLGTRLDLLFDALTSNGIKVSARDRINAGALAAELVARGQVSRISELRLWLAPLLARSPEQRALFAQVFQMVAPDAAPEPEAEPKPVPAEQAPVRPPRPWTVWAKVAILVMHIIISVLLGMAYLGRVPPKAPVVESQPSIAPLVTPAPAGPAPVTAPAPAPAPVTVPAAGLAALDRVAEAAERFEGAPTLEELGGALAASSPIGWPAASYAIRLHELSGLSRNWPLALYGMNGNDGRVWARLALALERIERPGHEPAFAALLNATKAALAKAATAGPRPVYELVARMTSAAPDYRAGLRDALLHPGRAWPDPAPPPDPLTVKRALAIFEGPSLDPIFADAPWASPIRSGAVPGWAAWLAAAIPLLGALYWAFFGLTWRRARLRSRLRAFEPLHIGPVSDWVAFRRFLAADFQRIACQLVAEIVARRRYQAADFQRIACQLARRTPSPSDRLDLEASIARTVASGGESLVPVRQTNRHAPEYLVLIERRCIGDQDARRLRELIGRLEVLLPLTVFYYRCEPSRLEPEPGGRAITIEQARAQYPSHRLLILGEGNGLLDPITLQPRPAAQALMHWPWRALLTPLPLAEWSHDEFALARALDLPIGRATPEGLATLAERLGLDGPTRGADGSRSDSAAGADPRGDGLARPLPEILRLHPQRWLHAAPPSDLPAEGVLRHLRNLLDRPGFDWLCALAVYPAVQWDLTLYLGVSLPEQPGGDPEILPLYRDDRLAALTQLPWLRHGQMPDWLRRSLIAELDPARAADIRALLSGMITQATVVAGRLHPAAPDAVILTLGHEPDRRAAAATAARLFEDEVLIDFLARGQTEGLACPGPVGSPAICPAG